MHSTSSSVQPHILLNFFLSQKEKKNERGRSKIEKLKTKKFAKVIQNYLDFVVKMTQITDSK